MKNQPRGIRRHHLNLTPASAATLERLVGHLSATHPGRRITATAVPSLANGLAGDVQRLFPFLLDDHQIESRVGFEHDLGDGVGEGSLAVADGDVLLDHDRFGACLGDQEKPGVGGAGLGA